LTQTFFVSNKTIFKWLSGGQEPTRTFNRKNNHPKGNKCGYDHNSARYHWLNLVPTNFNTRGNGSYTLEFRAFGETVDYYKIYYWLLFCFAFTAVCENHSNWIMDGFITDKEGLRQELNVLNLLKAVYTGKIREDVINYYLARKRYFEKHQDALEMNFIY